MFYVIFVLKRKKLIKREKKNIITVTKCSQLQKTGGNVMRNLDTENLAKVSSFENELKKPGSVIFLGTVASGFAIYGISAMFLIVYDIAFKVFS